MRKSFSVSLDASEILYDIMSKSHLRGEALAAAGKDFRAVSLMQACGDEEPAYRLARSVSSAWAHLRVELGEFVDDPGRTSADNAVCEAAEKGLPLSLELSMPSNFDPAAADSLGATLHEYIVDRSLSEWFLVTDKEDAQDYALLAEQALDRARRALFLRSRPSRPVYS